ncbi:MULTISPECIES: sigma-70 family RNA polymerase sigma factor [Lactobacillus]|uniref:Sigma-70 family RNA polymerase sigma factor n=1 Tax=Lactobacillus xujianguonis TaxID=2495899 RepID=A0A437SSC9_9LACO|nr:MULTISPECIES: sigma-70 family RNA polymerase sigma factor [Lactobacillus]RVU69808.1 sigma-70 family RNA polymerase sigma factor [Lactobacillus xujianguonis]RVU71886.1 sigma-70 family RNA polymerase sigma factor [Lactobacillus xujianguonis]
MKISKENFIAAWENKRLIAGALKAAHVWPHYDSYEDFFQEGVMIYAEMLEKHSKKSLKEVDKLSFNKILWHTIDELRKVQRISEHGTGIEEAAQLFEMEDWDNLLVIKREIAKMNERERVVFCEHMLGGKSMVAVSREYGIPLRTLKRVKERIITKLLNIFKH